LTGGRLVIKSEDGKGTDVEAIFSLKHIDRQPLGDIIGVLILLMAANEKIDFIYTHKTDTGEYRFSSKETMEFLEIDTLSDRILLEELRYIIGGNLKEIQASGFDLKKVIK
jgi:hypothetical protein